MQQWTVKLLHVNILVCYWLSLQHANLASAQAAETDSKKRLELSTMMRSLINEPHYDRWLRPNFYGEAVHVLVAPEVVSIDHVDVFNMHVAIDFHLRLNWCDARLAFEQFGFEHDIRPGHEFIDLIWKPDIYFPGERREQRPGAIVLQNNATFETEANKHEFGRQDSLLIITPDGNVTLIKEHTVTFRCAMDFSLYPFDVQQCRLQFESYGFTMDNIRLALQDDPDLGFDDDIELLEYELLPGVSYEQAANFSSGLYSRLVMLFQLHRLWANAAVQTFMPCLFTVVISWVPFWTQPEDKMERLALGVTTVLTMSTIHGSVNTRLPDVSYMRCIDVYLNVCYLMVFGSLIQCTLFGYLAQQQQQLKVKSVDSGSTVSLVSVWPETAIRLSRFIYPALFLLFNLIFITIVITQRHRKLQDMQRHIPLNKTL